jgi:cytochrome P450
LKTAILSAMSDAPKCDDLDFAIDPCPGQALHESLTRLREAGSVVETRFMNMPAYAITRYDPLLKAFRDGESFPPERIYQMMFEPICGPTFQTMTGRDHLIRRRLATPAFRADVVRKQDENEIIALANELIDDFPSNGEVDFAKHFTQLFPFIIISRLLGIPRDAEREFHGWARALLRFAEDHARAIAANSELTAYLEPIVAARRKAPRNDIISDLVQAEVDAERFTNEEVLSHVRLIFSAGAGTVHDAMGNLFYHLLLRSGLWEELKRDPSKRLRVVGVAIPPNSFMLFAIASANRDASAFPDPHTFKTNRPPKPIMTTFGPGPRACPGMHLARKELALVLDVVLERLPNLKLLDAEAGQPAGAVMRGPQTLPVSTD